LTVPYNAAALSSFCKFVLSKSSTHTRL